MEKSIRENIELAEAMVHSEFACELSKTAE